MTADLSAAYIGQQHSCNILFLQPFLNLFTRDKMMAERLGNVCENAGKRWRKDREKKKPKKDC
jgi:hypothetical protein